MYYQYVQQDTLNCESLLYTYFFLPLYIIYA